MEDGMWLLCASVFLGILGECRTLWGEHERAVTKSNLSSYSG